MKKEISWSRVAAVTAVLATLTPAAMAFGQQQSVGGVTGGGQSGSGAASVSTPPPVGSSPIGQGRGVGPTGPMDRAFNSQQGYGQPMPPSYGGGQRQGGGPMGGGMGMMGGDMDMFDMMGFDVPAILIRAARSKGVVPTACQEQRTALASGDQDAADECMDLVEEQATSIVEGDRKISGQRLGEALGVVAVMRAGGVSQSARVRAIGALKIAALEALDAAEQLAQHEEDIAQRQGQRREDQQARRSQESAMRQNMSAGMGGPMGQQGMQQSQGNSNQYGPTGTDSNGRMPNGMYAQGPQNNPMRQMGDSYGMNARVPMGSDGRPMTNQQMADQYNAMPQIMNNPNAVRATAADYEPGAKFDPRQGGVPQNAALMDARRGIQSGGVIEGSRPIIDSNDRMPMPNNPMGGSYDSRASMPYPMPSMNMDQMRAQAAAGGMPFNEDMARNAMNNMQGGSGMPMPPTGGPMPMMQPPMNNPPAPMPASTGESRSSVVSTIGWLLGALFGR